MEESDTTEKEEQITPKEEEQESEFKQTCQQTSTQEKIKKQVPQGESSTKIEIKP